MNHRLALLDPSSTASTDQASTSGGARAHAPARGRRAGGAAGPGAVAALLRILHRVVHAHRKHLLIFDAAGVICFAMGVYKMLQGTHAAVNIYDEGILLSHTRMVMWGRWPYRDFYTQYPPGNFFFMAALWKLFGTQVLVGRYLSNVTRVSLALLSGVVGGRLVRRRFTMLPAGLTMAWLALMPPPPFAWFSGLFWGLASVLMLARATHTSTRGRWIAAGVTLGLTASFRHDLFVYMAVTLAAPAVFWFRRRAMTRSDLVRIARDLGIGLAVPLAIFWVPTLVMVKWSLIYHDGFADQVHYVMPGRKMPIPPMTTMLDAPPWKHKLPAFLTDFTCMAFAVVFSGPLVGAVQAWRARRAGLDRAVAVLLTALAVAVLPQATGRADWQHAIYAITPSLTLAATLPMSFPRPRWWRVLPVEMLSGLFVIAFCAWALRNHHPPTGPMLPPVNESFSDGSPNTLKIPDDYAVWRRELRAWVVAHVPKDEPIFIGNFTIASLMVNEVDLYFILDRPAAMRYLQFDVGTVTRREVQEEMIRDLERRQTRFVILGRPPQWAEPFNDSVKPGSTYFDEYLRTHFKPVTTFGPYEVRMRNGTEGTLR